MCRRPERLTHRGLLTRNKPGGPPERRATRRFNPQTRLPTSLLLRRLHLSPDATHRPRPCRRQSMQARLPPCASCRPLLPGLRPTFGKHRFHAEPRMFRQYRYRRTPGGRYSKSDRKAFYRSHLQATRCWSLLSRRMLLWSEIIVPEHRTGRVARKSRPRMGFARVAEKQRSHDRNALRDRARDHRKHLATAVRAARVGRDRHDPAVAGRHAARFAPAEPPRTGRRGWSYSYRGPNTARRRSASAFICST